MTQALTVEQKADLASYLTRCDRAGFYLAYADMVLASGSPNAQAIYNKFLHKLKSPATAVEQQ